MNYWQVAAGDGDIVVLKRPSRKQWQVLAVGKVKGEYQYLPVFDDVEGRDLQHCRLVEWFLTRYNLFILVVVFLSVVAIAVPFVIR